MARTLELDTITEPSNSGTANITLSSDTTTTMPLVDINGGAIDSTTLGVSTPSSVAATTLTASGATTLNGDVTLGNASADTITVTGTMAGIDNKSGMTGEIRMWAGSSSPTGWLMCDGASVSRSTYSALYAITGDAFGTASGSTFNVPDMRGRMPVGVGTGIGGAAEDTDGGTVPVGGSALTARSLGEWAGAEVLSTAHTAASTTPGATGSTTPGAGGSTTPSPTGSTAPGSTSGGGGHSHTLTAATSNGSGSIFNITNGYTSLTNYGATRTQISGGGHEHTSPAHTHTSAAHTHTGAAHTHTSAAHTHTIADTGSSSKFTTPIMCVNFIIKT